MSLCFFRVRARAAIYTLSLHDALPISVFLLSSTFVLVNLAVDVVYTYLDPRIEIGVDDVDGQDRKSTRLNSSHVKTSYAVFCLKKKKDSSLTAQPPLPAAAPLQSLSVT